MNYGELRTQFMGLLNRRDLTTTLRDTFIQQGIARAQRKLRVPAMEATSSVTISGATYVDGLLIPADFLELIALTCEDTTLRRMDLNIVRAAALETGNPTIYCRQGGRLLLAPTPTAGLVVRIDYYGEFDTLSVDADTNFLSDIAPDVILYGALSFACDYYLDNRAQAFEARFTQGLEELQAQALRDELTAGAALGAAHQYPEDL